MEKTDDNEIWKTVADFDNYEVSSLGRVRNKNTRRVLKLTNKLNNKIDNLEWVTNKENQVHKFQSGLGNNFTRKIGQYDLENNIIKEFSSIKEAMDELKIKTIKEVLYGKQKTAGGFIWKYLDENY